MTEFSLLANFKPDPTRCTLGMQYSDKNRYLKWYAYDGTMPYVPHVPYINATWIPMNSNPNSVTNVIATQGPMESTAKDFWTMVEHYESPLIVMLTGCWEGIVEKCCDYTDIHTLELNVKRKNVVQVDPFQWSDIDYRFHEEHKTIKHLFYPWIDGKTPSTIKNLFDLVEFVQPFLGIKPVVIHCSAGLGRTGLLLAALYHHLHPALEPSQIVETLRQYRAGLVHNEEQYEFLKAYCKEKQGISFYG